MPHVIERASSGRAKCRGCSERIAKGEWRLGERRPNPFADGETTHWFHLTCAAYKRPEPMVQALKTAGAVLERRDWLESRAAEGLAHRRLPRIDGAERAPTGRARCRCCRETIEKGSWRIALVFHEEGRFQPSGSIHARCSRSYFDTDDVIERVKHFRRTLTEDDLGELRAELRRSS